ncbi:cbb3-type cytochrome c oxidase subunit 3 [Paracoccus siganidrum]|uniref:Cbb3-type cytochrome c oxidase subunit 3 n=1 Tax=Paracoccus siganidrum TaxID=1276757 RepID=A0A419A609_9RHOB|nr:cbb3-type cytochrome c oxidase subunit 3 [Paracoccus siganidrum]RJL12795.1 cbb3-type cytochrome c oxidase subunit 3 [Paracoccus siganidrum]RMC41115.1 cbb3-type cytochrome c oxidase subunit 3 [Paracoccus siganidrum]
MELYSFLRQLADSWALLALTLFFVGMVGFVFRPGSRVAQKDAAESIFRHETRPATADEKESR